MAIGTRKGETIGFRWSWLNKKTKVLRVRKQRQRHTYQHGCTDPIACTVGRHRGKACRQPCTAHKRRCPPPCPPDCAKHACTGPQRVGGVVDVDVKSQAGRRGIRLPDQLFELLMGAREDAGPGASAPLDYRDAEGGQFAGQGHQLVADASKMLRREV